MSWLSRGIPAFVTREPIIIGAALLVVAQVWIFAELTDEVTEGELQSFDRFVEESLQVHHDGDGRVGPTWLIEAMRDVTSLGSITVLAIIVTMAAILLWLAGARRAAVLIVVASITGHLLSSIAKQLIGRPRPPEMQHLTTVHTASFPSGHSMLSTVVYFTLATIVCAILTKRRKKFFVLGMAFVLSAVVGISRVYLGVHYPSDVLAGWSIGLAWALICWIAAKFLQSWGALDRTLTNHGG